ncbi:MAG: Holliday junction branch migration protein RuvA [Prevotellaceae bacterium]|jgi:Holliday junction DNA helicase RuvA|nr:Holliday junction branch migration protein RuvA [Prevotellaceae bacterium]
MYEYIKGTVAELTPTYVVVETGGIGYFVHISLQTYGQLGELKDVQLWLHHIVREDAEQWFGFFSREEREVFRLLVSVSGVGPNTARMVLSSLTSADVRNAIQCDDVHKLQNIKGIGTKTAQRLVVDLKDKIGKTISSNTLPGLPALPAQLEEALSALVMLGFSKAPAEKTLQLLLRENAACSTEDLIKAALKRL